MQAEPRSTATSHLRRSICSLIYDSHYDQASRNTPCPHPARLQKASISDIDHFLARETGLPPYTKEAFCKWILSFHDLVDHKSPIGSWLSARISHEQRRGDERECERGGIGLRVRDLDQSVPPEGGCSLRGEGTEGVTDQDRI